MTEGRWGVVLAGGGGKGSYQIGVLKALSEYGVLDRLVSVAGTSVGALNTIFYAQKNAERAVEIWKNIDPVEFLDMQYLVQVQGGVVREMMERASKSGICSRDGLIRILEEEVDLELIGRGEVEMTICAAKCQGTEDLIKDGVYSKEREAVYKVLNGLSEDEMKLWLMASSALPYVYPPVLIEGETYRDGGIVDNIPVRALLGKNIDTLLVVKLESDDKVNTDLYPEFPEVIELAPSREIGDFLDGTLDFNGDNVDFRVQLGYQDMIRTLQARVLKNAGIPLTEEQLKMREEEDFQKVIRKNKVNRAIDNMNYYKDLIGKLEEKADSIWKK